MKKRRKRPHSLITTWRQLKRAVARGHIIPMQPDRLAIARHRRGKRGHETAVQL